MPKKKIFIEALEQRIMLDGAGASTILDLVDDRNKEENSIKSSKETVKFNKLKISEFFISYSALLMECLGIEPVEKM